MSLHGAGREDLLRSAEKLVSRGKIEAAIKQYRKVLDANPGDTSILNLVGDLYARVKRYAEAVELYERTAGQFEREGFYVKAIAVYKKISRLVPERLDTYAKLAELYRRQGLIKEAISHYQVLATDYTQRDEIDAAIGVYERLAELEPDELGHRMQLAQLFKRAGLPERVIGEYLAIGRFMLAHGRAEEAIKVFLHGLDVDPDATFYVEDVLEVLRAAGHTDAAMRFLAQAERRSDRIAELALGRDLAFEVASPPSEAPLAPAAREDSTDGGERQPADDDLLGEDPDEIPPPPRTPSPPPPLARPAPPRAAAQLPANDLHVTRPPARRGGSRVSGSQSSRGDEEELLAEAEVFVKYGLQQKALDRLEEVLELAPRNLSAFRQLIAIHLALRNWEDAATAASRMVVVARESGNERQWEESRELMESSGFSFRGNEVLSLPGEQAMAPPAPEPAEDEGAEVASDPPLELPPLPTDREDRAVAATLAESQVLMEMSEEATAGSFVESPESMPSDLDLLVRSQNYADTLDEFGQVVGADLVIPPPPPDDDEAIFDLAAELVQELAEEEDPMPAVPVVGASVLDTAERKVRAIVDGFKTQVAAQLSPEDSDTHYNLGIAFREMGLLDEAIGEFETASRSSEHRLDCCSVLAQCLQEKGLHEEAIRWLQRGLGEERLSENQRLALLYQVGDCYESQGAVEAAHEVFLQITSVDAGYRDVSARVADLTSEL